MPVLLAIVADKTGYPPEMLDLDMGLDADLGIDSIKRVEILSALQEQLPEAPAVKPEHLGTLHTLRQIVDFLSEPEALATAKARAVANASGSEVVSGTIAPDRVRDVLAGELDRRRVARQPLVTWTSVQRIPLLRS